MDKRFSLIASMQLASSGYLLLNSSKFIFAPFLY